jgi:hypothetical protein
MSRYEAHGRAVLNWEKVEEIRASHLPERTLAAVYRCHRSTIGCVRRGQSWVLREEEKGPEDRPPGPQSTAPVTTINPR